MAGKRGFVERRPDGTYAVRKAGSKRASVVVPTQREAIAWAHAHDIPNPDVERVRDTAKGRRDQWRK